MNSHVQFMSIRRGVQELVPKSNERAFKKKRDKWLVFELSEQKSLITLNDLVSLKYMLISPEIADCFWTRCEWTLRLKSLGFYVIDASHKAQSVFIF